MTNEEMLSECKRMAPDFALTRRGDTTTATCIIGGKRHELSEIGPEPSTTRMVLYGCWDSLRRGSSGGVQR